MEDYNDDTCFDVILQDENLPREALELKSSDFCIQGTNLGGGEQAAQLIDEDLGGDALTVQSDLTQVVHGTMSAKGAPATLAVFQFTFLPRVPRVRFKEVRIVLTFSAGEVHGIAPRYAEPISRSEKLREVSHAISPNIAATFGTASASTGYTWQLKDSQTVKANGKVQGLKKAIGQHTYGARKRMNTAVWELSENEQTESGIPSFVQTAVLLQREGTEKQPLGEKFSAEVQITGKVGGWAYVKNKWKTIAKSMLTRKHKGKDVFFNPKQSRGSLEDTDNSASCPAHGS